MGIKEDWSRVKDHKKYGETIERVFGKRIKIPTQDSQEFNQLQAELLAILLVEREQTAAVKRILNHLIQNYSL